jgi:hypothetical protein
MFDFIKRHKIAFIFAGIGLIFSIICFFVLSYGIWLIFMVYPFIFTFLVESLPNDLPYVGRIIGVLLCGLQNFLLGLAIELAIRKRQYRLPIIIAILILVVLSWMFIASFSL